MKKNEQVISVVKTMALLETLSKTEELGVTEISRIVGSSKSTVYRFLNTLVQLGYVRQNTETEKYSLTLRTFQVGVHALNRLDLYKAALPFMKDLAVKTEETIHLASIENGRVFYVDKIESTQALKVAMSSAQGRFVSSIHSAVGKAILSWQGADEQEKIIDNADWNPATPHSVRTKEDLYNDINQSRSNGYSLDWEENEKGVRCIAAPIFDDRNIVCAALSISGPSIRMSKKHVIDELAPLVMHAATEISRSLGSTEIKKSL